MLPQLRNYPTLLTFLLECFLIIQGLKIDVVVSQNGRGHYRRIVDAVQAAPSYGSRRFNIKIEAGTYYEYVEVPPDKENLSFIGDGIDRTIISGSKSYRGGIPTYDTATVGIRGAGFVARDMTFENTAGEAHLQAIALRSDVTSAFYRCKFQGYQDTLCPLSGTQFYRDCQIFGTVDFIFGDAKVVFQNCDIFARLPQSSQLNTIVSIAQGRGSPFDLSGTVIHNCNFLPTYELRQALKNSSLMIRSFLGRPWGKYSTMVVLQSYIDEFIDPSGWAEWKPGYGNLETVFVGEFQNRGPGNRRGKRVNWKGFHGLTRNKASEFTVRNFINGDRWLPSTEIPFYPDLL